MTAPSPPQPPLDGGDPDRPPVLLLCAHGTDDPAGRAVVDTLAARVGEHLGRREPAVRVVQTWVDVQQPQIGETLAGLVATGEQVVVVPALLSGGFHTQVDIARAVAAHPGRAVAAPALGPDERLADLLHRRLRQAGAEREDAVVLAAAGSSRPESVRDVERVAAALAQRWGALVGVGYGAKAAPSLAEAVERARAAGAGRVVLASYLLAPGFFHDRVRRQPADLVTEPLGAADEIVQIVLDRYSGWTGRSQAS